MGGLLVGDLVKVKNEALTSDWAKKQSSNLIEKLKEFVDTDLNVRVSSVKALRPSVSSGVHAESQVDDYYCDIVIETAPGLYNQFITLPIALLDAVEQDVNLSDTYMTMPTRGCPFACTFCVNSEFLKMYPHQKPIRMRTVDNIIDELNLVKKTMPFVKQILFNDDAFFLMPVAMIKDFSKKYEEQIKMPLIITGATPSTLSKTKLSILADAGLVGLRMGIQTLAENSKKLYKRPHSNAAIMAAVKVINEQKERVNVNYDFILESPWDTDDNTIETLRFVAQIPPPYNLNLFRIGRAHV